MGQQLLTFDNLIQTMIGFVVTETKLTYQFRGKVEYVPIV